MHILFLFQYYYVQLYETQNAKLSPSPAGKSKDVEHAVYITDVAENCKLKMDKNTKNFPLKIKIHNEGLLSLQVS
jgi:hypothetical protein